MDLEFRQKVVDAAIEEMRRQLGQEFVQVHGTRVDIEGSFKMARVLEAAFAAAFDGNPGLIEEVARSLAPVGDEWENHVDPATDAVMSVAGYIASRIDPLP